ncbi:MAG TPA: T9SS type A sorting domain-containing protein [Chitinophagaceae bacterium]|nr:T9SS type A sorting domain-containing protein [Chitinophagaceae bacterium]
MPLILHPVPDYMKSFRLITVLFLCFVSFAANAYQKVIFYVVAHPDDWQLFMGIEAYHDIQDTSNKVVFIITTSGDATFTNPSVNMKFALARENGVLNSVRFCSDMKSELDSSCRVKRGAINDHRILHYPYKNVITYFLRLPDGCLSAGYKGQSLEYLYQHRIDELQSIDGQETYSDWDDLVQTTRAIIQKELGGQTWSAINFQDFDERYNPRDHPDHRYSGKIALEASAYFPYMNRVAYVDYDVAKRAINLSPEDISIKAGIFALADFGITEYRERSAFDQRHISFLMRSYSRTVDATDTFATGMGPRLATAYAYPNPCTTGSSLIFSLKEDKEVSLALMNVNGTVLWQQEKTPAHKGQNKVDIPVAQLVAGTYFIRLQQDGSSETVKLIRN